MAASVPHARPFSSCITVRGHTSAGYWTLVSSDGVSSGGALAAGRSAGGERGAAEVVDVAVDALVAVDRDERRNARMIRVLIADLEWGARRARGAGATWEPPVRRERSREVARHPLGRPLASAGARHDQPCSRRPYGYLRLRRRPRGAARGRLLVLGNHSIPALTSLGLACLELDPCGGATPTRAAQE